MSSYEIPLRYRRRRASRLQTYLALARLSNAPTVATNVLAGAAIAGALSPTPALFILIAAMMLFYSAGMFLNDLRDYRRDLVERPRRPLPSKGISHSEAALATVAMFAVGILMLWYINISALPWGLMLVALIVAYDLWHRGNPIGPLLMAATRAMVYVVAFTALASGFSGRLALLAAMLGVYVTGLTVVAKYEARARGGAAGAFLILVAAVVPAVVQPSVWVVILALAFCGWALYSLYSPSGSSPVGQLIAGISLYDAVVMAVVGAYAGIPVALAAFAATLYLQRHIKGT